MPRDKTATHIKLLQCIRKEFLEKGYEEASLNHIAKMAGITSAGVYRHFTSKEDMFISLVEPTLNEFKELWKKIMDDICADISDKSSKKNYSRYRKYFSIRLLEFIYENDDHMQGAKLLVTCSHGTKYENFENYLVEMDVNATKELVSKFKDIGVHCNEISDDELRAVATVFVFSFCEIIKHQFPKKLSYEYVDFIDRLLNPGCKDIIGF